MSDPVPDSKEVVKRGHLNEIKDNFLEPSQSSMSTEQMNKLSKLYDIAYEFEPDDPIGWMKDFNMSHQLDLEIGTETTRVGKMLAMAEIFKKSKKLKQSKMNRRDF